MPSAAAPASAPAINIFRRVVRFMIQFSYPINVDLRSLIAVGVLAVALAAWLVARVSSIARVEGAIATVSALRSRPEAVIATVSAFSRSVLRSWRVAALGTVAAHHAAAHAEARPASMRIGEGGDTEDRGDADRAGD
ncbi:MAG: hypothetical protein A3G81_02725 [Betaproteobacteria bacterium RIFCSPLOWO2_12_FULL_65_14]|nr:MAG: hypothetical protein A3G81_02725 [Betaproteobacteria bacterium RIFCSPLOWO2_12_FULL_65_14]